MSEKIFMPKQIPFCENPRLLKNIWDITDRHTGSDEYMRDLAERSEVDFQAIFDDMVERYERNEEGIPHLDGTVGQEMCVNSYTFGAFEPTYLEILGTEGVDALRKMDHPRFLLVGSFGRYSSEEFYDFFRKINPNAGVFVVDIDAFQIPFYDEVREGRNICFSIADGKKVPFRENSFDVVCTNHLLHFLAGDCMAQARTDAKVLEFLNEMFRVIKSGGEMLLAEQKYGYYKVNDIPKERQRESFSKIAQASFFENGAGESNKMTPGYHYAFRNDIGSVDVSSNSESFYPKNPLILKDRDLFGARLSK